MSWVDRLLGRKAAELTYDQIASLIDGTSAGRVAGVAVNDKTALQVSTVLACVKAIADGCATPDLHVFREKSDGTSEKALNIPEYRLLSRRPNEWQTSYEWRRLMTLHAALTGAALSIKVRGDNRRVRELIPVSPGNWDVRHVSRYEVRYRCWDQFGIIGEFPPEDVFVLHGLQWEVVGSLNAVHLARMAIGMSIATEQSQASMHENGMRPSGVYSVEGSLSPAQYTQLAAHLKSQYAGAAKSGTPLILDRAAKWISTAMSGVDAQHVETRRLQVEEICRAYSVFPIMVGHSDKAATFASSEAFFAAHLKHTLKPWHKAWRDRIDETLLDGSGPLYVKFDTRYLTEGAMKDRAQWARTMTEMGIYTRNEIREEEGKDPLPGLDEPLTPMNMGGSAPDPAADEAQAKQFDKMERKLDALAMRQAPTTIELSTTRVEKALDTALQAMAFSYAEKLKSIADSMPINITTPAPVVNFAPVFAPNMPAPNVTFEATMPAPTVIFSGPKSSTQKVERDADGEIAQTVTTFDYPPKP